MSESLSGYPGGPQQSPSTTDAVKGEAQGVAGDAASSAGAVGGVAKQEATNVAHEAKYQAKDLYHQGRQELMEQAASQQSRAAEGLRSIHRELHSMASNSEGSGVGTDLVRQAATRAGSFADWLDARDPGSLLEEVKGYARRKPGTFLAIAAGAGLLAGRLSRSLAANASDGGAQAPSRSAQVPAQPTQAPAQTAAPTAAYPTGEGFPTDGSYAAGAGAGAGVGSVYPPVGEYPEETGYGAGAGYGQGLAGAGEGYPEETGYAEHAAGTVGNPDYAAGPEEVDEYTGRHASGLIEPRDPQRGELP
jgi:hypothetical protein